MPAKSDFQTADRGALPRLYKASSTGAPIEWEIWVEKEDGLGVMVTEFGRVGGKKQLLREKIAQGKNVGRSNATTSFQQATAEAISRWEKQKSRKGYGLEVEESREIRGLSPMLAKVYEKERKKVEWDTAFAQPKLDGFRCIVRRVGKAVKAFSRENQPLNVPHILDTLRSILKNDEALDGELYCHGMSLPQISSACKRLQESTSRLVYHVYDTPTIGDYSARHAMLKDIVGDAANGLQLVETIKVRNDDELMIAQQRFIDEGYEGAMLRHGKSGYEAGKRSSSLLKVKTFQDGEFKIVDYKMGRGKYDGVPVFTCTTKEGHDFDVLAPGKMKEKRALGDDADKLVGKMLTVKYIYLTKTEEPVPFLPVAVALREDEDDE